ncbi:MAG: SH3 domain-containing protein [Anaerolineae bacterium]|nr:SH3 domain-containing protein [Anaerolineae bacterium]
MNRSGMRVIVLALTALLLLGSGWAALPAQAQTGQGINPDAAIIWPPPVYVLRGEVEVYGSASLPNMRNYFLSFRPLSDSLDPLTAEFLPAMLPRPFSVENDVLGVWDTTTTDDGLYELRLTVNVRGAAPVIHIVSPLRVENNPPPFADLFATPTPAFPTAIPQPTLDPTPRGTVSGAAANVRTGDSTEFPVITTLRRDEQVLLIGVSNRGTGWYQVRLANGRIGWMAPSVINVSGNLGLLPFVSPPPLPPTPTPPPTVTPSPTPFSAANLVAGIVVFDPPTPTCAQTFIVGVDVANLGSEQTFSPGTVTVTDTRAADGTVQQTNIGGFPPLLPGQTTRVNVPMTISTYYNEVHRLTITVDSGSIIPESNETDNVRVIEYVLQKGACP